MEIARRAVTFNDRLYAEAIEFLYAEADLLDSRRFDEWLEVLTEDIIYRVPVQLALKDKEASSVSEMDWYDENLETLRFRVYRLGTAYAWAEDPPSRTRHLITNVRVRCADNHELHVDSNVLVFRNQASAPGADLLSGERHDLLRKVNGDWRLARRTMILDHGVIGTGSLGIFL
jgi:ethylbenzene dioxygenase beta subunit